MRYLIFISLLFTTISLFSETYYYAGDIKKEISISDNFIGFKTIKNYSELEIRTILEKIINSNINQNSINNRIEAISINQNTVVVRFSNKLLNKNELYNEITKYIPLDFETMLFNLTDSRFKRDAWPLLLSKEIVVKFKNVLTESEINNILKNENLKIVKKMKTTENGYILQAISPIDALNSANRVFESGLAVFSEPHFFHFIKQFATPNDTYFSNQWHLRSSTGGVYALDAWSFESGSEDIKIAIVDDGLDLNHEDLNLAGYKNFTTEDYELGGAHGTSCAGVAAAKGNNLKGVSGLCPNCRIISAKMMADERYEQGTGADGIEWATNNGADVISNSWGFQTYVPIPSYLSAAITYATTNGRNRKGAVVVFASGNDDREFYNDELPAHPNVICVGASDYRDKRSSYSNYGSRLDVVAPSSSGGGTTDYDNIWTTDAYSDSGSDSRGYNHDGWLYQDGYNTGMRDISGTGKYTKFFGGTSSATPLVSGLVGLILSKNPTLTYTEVRTLIRNNADKVGETQTYSNGFSRYYGYGRINASKTIRNTPSTGCEPDPAGEDCSNGADDDCDGKIDADDGDCTSGNSCTSEIEIVTENTTINGNTSSALYTNNFTAPDGCSNEITNSNDIVYQIILSSRRQFIADIISASFDTVIYLKSGCESTTSLYCNDDAENGVNRSKLSVILEAGTYYLVVDGYSNANNGEFQLSISFESPDICENVTCSGHGSCQNIAGVAVCNCDIGYYRKDLTCVLEAELCEGITCSGRGECQVDNGLVNCRCNSGYHSEGIFCEKDTLCTYVQCNSNSTCNLEDGECYCDAGYYLLESTGECQAYNQGTLCENVSCNPHSTCSYDDGLCYCNMGYELDNGVCVLEKSTNTSTTCSFNSNSNQNYLIFLLFIFSLISIRKYFKSVK
ncbi:S8 family serine peptidase [bacterium]|nr:S8 family serine peptidase [bacterium]